MARLESTSTASLLSLLSSREASIASRLSALTQLGLTLDRAEDTEAAELCAQLREAHALDHFLRLLREPLQPSLHPLALMLVGNMCSKQADPQAQLTHEALATAHGFEAILPFLFADDSTTLIYALGAVQNTCGEARYQDMLLKLELASLLQEHVHSENETLATFAKGALANMNATTLEQYSSAELRVSDEQPEHTFLAESLARIADAAGEAAEREAGTAVGLASAKIRDNARRILADRDGETQQGEARAATAFEVQHVAQVGVVTVSEGQVRVAADVEAEMEALVAAGAQSASQAAQSDPVLAVTSAISEDEAATLADELSSAEAAELAAKAAEDRTRPEIQATNACPKASKNSASQERSKMVLKKTHVSVSLHVGPELVGGMHLVSMHLKVSPLTTLSTVDPKQPKAEAVRETIRQGAANALRSSAAPVQVALHVDNNPARVRLSLTCVCGRAGTLDNRPVDAVTRVLMRRKDDEECQDVTATNSSIVTTEAPVEGTHVGGRALEEPDDEGPPADTLGHSHESIASFIEPIDAERSARLADKAQETRTLPPPIASSSRVQMAYNGGRRLPVALQHLLPRQVARPAAKLEPLNPRPVRVSVKTSRGWTSFTGPSPNRRPSPHLQSLHSQRRSKTVIGASPASSSGKSSVGSLTPRSASSPARQPRSMPRDVPPALSAALLNEQIVATVLQQSSARNAAYADEMYNNQRATGGNSKPHLPPISRASGSKLAEKRRSAQPTFDEAAYVRGLLSGGRGRGSVLV